jgi:hypothetical protein
MGLGNWISKEIKEQIPLARFEFYKWAAFVLAAAAVTLFSKWYAAVRGVPDRYFYGILFIVTFVLFVLVAKLATANSRKRELSVPTLAERTFALCKEMKAYIKQMPRPECPAVDDKSDYVFGAYIHWQDGFTAGYLRRFSEKVTAIRHELAEKGLRDGDVDIVIGANIMDDKKLRKTIEALIVLAAKLDD